MIRIAVRELDSNGRLMVLASTKPHEVWLRLMISHLKLT